MAKRWRPNFNWLNLPHTCATLREMNYFAKDATNLFFTIWFFDVNLLPHFNNGKSLMHNLMFYCGFVNVCLKPTMWFTNFKPICLPWNVKVNYWQRTMSALAKSSENKSLAIGIKTPFPLTSCCLEAVYFYNETPLLFSEFRQIH